MHWECNKELSLINVRNTIKNYLYVLRGGEGGGPE